MKLFHGGQCAKMMNLTYPGQQKYGKPIFCASCHNCIWAQRSQLLGFNKKSMKYLLKFHLDLLTPNIKSISSQAKSLLSTRQSLFLLCWPPKATGKKLREILLDAKCDSPPCYHHVTACMTKSIQLISNLQNENNTNKRKLRPPNKINPVGQKVGWNETQREYILSTHNTLVLREALHKNSQDSQTFEILAYLVRLTDRHSWGDFVLIL